MENDLLFTVKIKTPPAEIAYSIPGSPGRPKSSVEPTPFHITVFIYANGGSHRQVINCQLFQWFIC